MLRMCNLTSLCKILSYQRCANAASAITTDGWMFLFQPCFDSGVFWPEPSAAPTVRISQILFLFRNTWLYWDGNRVRWFNRHTRGAFLGCQSFCNFGGLLSEIRHPEGRLGDHEMPWFKARRGDMKSVRRWKSPAGNYCTLSRISKGD